MILPSAARRLVFSVAMIVAGWVGGVGLGAGPSPTEAAHSVDRLLAEEVFTPETRLAPPVSDAAFLRRVWLDIVGDIPTPEHITAFVLDPAKDKRRRVVAELLAEPQYGQNWARYWRDVILSRKLEERAAIVASPVVVTLTQKFNNNESWDHIATSFITATGDVRENGATAIEMAQDGRTEEIAAEVSRIFLGIQIQCAQCHDHKTDRWKREQFHELAAFFPRVAVRPLQSPVKRSFEVVADDRPDNGRRPNPNAQGRRGEAEHYMPDMENPSARGTRIQPKFFLTSDRISFGIPDAERRATIARWITANPWFATALVNRLWAELVGEGFYEPIDDMGPDRTPSAPKTVKYLSQSFAESGYDVKWLFQTICATEAYQRESRPRRNADDGPFTANVAQPLRSDQLFNALLSAFDMPETDIDQNRRGRPGGGNPYGRNASPRVSFEAAFGFDPSDPRDSVNASIPQALALMNGTRVNLGLRAIGDESILGQLLGDTNDNKVVVEELYLRTLSREPSENEMSAALEHCRTSGDRESVFEDLLWALVNSSEFSHRR